MFVKIWTRNTSNFSHSLDFWKSFGNLFLVIFRVILVLVKQRDDDPCSFITNLFSNLIKDGVFFLEFLMLENHVSLPAHILFVPSYDFSPRFFRSMASKNECKQLELGV